PLSYSARVNPYGGTGGDLNRDGFPDLVVTNDNSVGTVTGLINAADWNTGSAAHRERPLPTLVPAPAHGGLSLNPLSTQRSRHDQPDFRQPRATSADSSSNPFPAGPVLTDPSQPVPPKAVSIPARLFIVLPWLDPWVDGFAGPVIDEYRVLFA